jgi:SAM-dependent methyltransferase
MDMAGFYSKVRARGLVRHAHQWNSLVSFGQERVVYAVALEKLSPRSRVLDWGCGNGHFSYFLAEHGHAPDAFALSEKPILVHEMPAIRFTQGADRTALPYPQATFDAVFALGVIEHVAEHGGDERGSLAELARVLKPGGLLYVFHLPNRGSWIEAAKWCTWRLGITSTREHLRRFTRASFLGLLQGLPFELTGEGRYHFLPRATLGRLPGLKDSPLFAAAVNSLDNVLAQLLAPFVQNRYFVLQVRKPNRL